MPSIPSSSATPTTPWSIESSVQIAIETTGTSGSVAILEGERVHLAVTLPDSHRTASSLAPALKDLLGECDSSGLKVNLVSVAIGPGSFTGLRVGITTAKTFCYARRLPLVAVDSLAAVAASVMHERKDVQTVLVGLNAYRRQIFAAEFRHNELLGKLDSLGPLELPDAVSVMEEEAWRDRIERFYPEVSLASPDVLLAGDTKVFAAHADTPRFHRRRETDAVGVGLLGLRLANAAKFVDPLALVPRYLKLSAAEEKLRT